MKKKNVISRNYLEGIPKRNSSISWVADENGIVTLDIENTGIMNRIAQKILKKPKISHIHLDELGSFVWHETDGKKDIVELGRLVENQFGDKVQPLYERLAKYFQILESYGFVKVIIK